MEQSHALGALYHGVVLSGDAGQIEGMINLARKILGVSAHLGNAPLQVTAEDTHLPALRRSMYATASGLLIFSQGELQDVIGEPENTAPPTFMDMLANGWKALNDKLKSVF